RLLLRSSSGSWRGTLTGLGLWALGWLLGSLPAVSVWAQESDVPTMSEAEAVEFYQTRVLPVLEKNCFECHRNDPAELGGSFSLRSHKSVAKGGDSGPAIDPANPKESLIVKVINYDVYEMPPDGKLKKEEIADLTLWVQLGMPGLEEGSEEADQPAGHQVPQVDDQARNWWAFRPVQASQPPAVANQAWVKNPIDQFVLAKLEAAGIQPAPPATRAALVRRAYYDLIGLPPTLEQVEQFVNDSDPAAYENLINTLLESPHYGEKWGRHWLDLVRYAESNSFERDGTKPFVWRYRDYVIRAFNQDKPYAQFLLEQLAGDELPEVTAETLAATGYYRLGQWDDEPADPLQSRYDELDDILATTSQTMLGLTVNCARCHDHKIDPMPQSDYYQMLAFFHNIRGYGVRSGDSVKEGSIRQFGNAESKEALEAQRQRIAELIREMGQLEEIAKQDFIPVEHEEFQYEFQRIPLLKKRVGKALSAEQFEQYVAWAKERKQLEQNPVAGEQEILCVKEQGVAIPQTYVLARGNPHVQGKPVEPGFLSVLSLPVPPIEPPPHGESTGLRTAFAKWLIDPEHPLTSRVMVNRIWQYHFGRGIVRTSSDFGYQGSLPTHPELLEWLATEFVERGWSMKEMHRLMMLSNTYQMAYVSNAELEQRDPLNDLMWRFDLRRLTAEEIRDSILFASGSLNLGGMFGPSIYPLMPAEVLAGQSIPGNGWETSQGEAQNRRSVYVHVKRSLKLPVLANHDSADSDFSCPVRFVTTQPTQALSMLNSDFSLEQAEKLAELVRGKHPEDLAGQVKTVLARITQREPKAEEVARGVKLIERWVSQEQLDPRMALRNFCLLALNLNEFVYLD
ncbi:MAG: PSD1 and planctomycete cytochrome C domain-containing protein, partial [Planctomycetota bacterium]